VVSYVVRVDTCGRRERNGARAEMPEIDARITGGKTRDELEARQCFDEVAVEYIAVTDEDLDSGGGIGRQTRMDFVRSENSPPVVPVLAPAQQETTYDEDSWGRHGSRDPETKPRFLDCRRCQPVDGGNVGCSTHHLTVVLGDSAVGQVYSILEADAHEITAEG